MSDLQFGFSADLDVQESQLPGGHIYSGLAYVGSVYSEAEGKSPEKVSYNFKNKDGGLVSIEILAPDLSKTKPVGKMSAAQMYDFFKRTCNHMFRGIAIAFELDMKKLPPNPSFKAVAQTLTEALEPELKAAEKKLFHIKVTKNKDGFPTVGNAGIFIQRDKGQPHTLFFDDRELGLNKIERKARTADSSTEETATAYETSESTVDDLNLGGDNPLSQEDIPDPFKS